MVVFKLKYLSYKYFSINDFVYTIVFLVLMNIDSSDIAKKSFNTIKSTYLPNLSKDYIVRFSIGYDKHWLRNFKSLSFLIVLFKVREFYLEIFFIDNTITKIKINNSEINSLEKSVFMANKYIVN